MTLGLLLVLLLGCCSAAHADCGVRVCVCDAYDARPEIRQLRWPLDCCWWVGLGGWEVITYTS